MLQKEIYHLVLVCVSRNAVHAMIFVLKLSSWNYSFRSKVASKPSMIGILMSINIIL